MAGSRAAFRLGFAPVLLLGWNMATGDPVPFLGPALAVFLLVSPTRPPLKQLVGALVLVVGLTWALSRLFAGLADSPAAVWIALLAVAAGAFARLARRPGDMPAMLTLISASIVVVIREFAERAGLYVPWLMGGAVAQAIAATLIAHALLPSGPTAAARPAPPAPGQAEVAVAFGKGAALVALLGVTVLLSDNSAILAALTAVTILAAPATRAARAQGDKLLLANATAAIVVLPLLGVAAVLPRPAILLLMALAGGLWMAAGIRGGGSRRVIAQAGMPVFVMLLGALLPKAGETALPLLIDRLLTLGLVMVYALAVLTLLRRVVVRNQPGFSR